MKRFTTIGICAWMLVFTMPHAMSADNTTKPPIQAKDIVDKACPDISPEETTRLALIQQMLNEGKPHAAIAYLDAAKIKNAQAELLRAHGLRQTGRALQAHVIYEHLVNTCVSGHAYRGLGLIASNGGNLQASLRYLQAASQTLPTEYTIRNDLGYVLMQSGQPEPALHEFLTALELAPDYRQAAHNLVLLLYQQGDTARAETFAKQFGIAAEELQHLKKMTNASHQAHP